MKAKLTKDRESPTGPLPAGTVIDDPQAYRLCQLGIAEPADEECRAKLGLPPLRTVTCATPEPTPAPAPPAPKPTSGVLYSGDP